MWIHRCARALHEVSIQTEIQCVSGHIGITANEEADHQANLAREVSRSSTVRQRGYTLVVNKTKQIPEAKMAAKAQWESVKCRTHLGVRLNGTAGSHRPILLYSVKPLAARFYRVKSGHAPLGMYLTWFRHRDCDKCWWCGGGGRTVARIWEYVCRHYSQKKDLQKTFWKVVCKATQSRARRC
jgi:hypothetical protein